MYSLNLPAQTVSNNFDYLKKTIWGSPVKLKEGLCWQKIWGTGKKAIFLLPTFPKYEATIFHSPEENMGVVGVGKKHSNTSV